MKYALALIAMLALSVPAFAQETETLPDGRKVRIENKDGSVIIEEVEEEAGDAEEAEKGFGEDLEKRIDEIFKRLREKGVKIEEESEEVEEGELPEDFKEIIERFRKQMEEMRKDMEERMKKVREEMEKGESGPDGEEVEEYEHKSPDGKTHVKIKIVRIKKTSSSGGEKAPETPEAPKKETERKQ